MHGARPERAHRAATRQAHRRRSRQRRRLPAPCALLPTSVILKRLPLAPQILTPEEFVAAGDFLVHTCPTWSWEAGDTKKARPFLPAGKQFLITRNGERHGAAHLVRRNAHWRCVQRGTEHVSRHAAPAQQPVRPHAHAARRRCPSCLLLFMPFLHPRSALPAARVRGAAVRRARGDGGGGGGRGGGGLADHEHRPSAASHHHKRCGPRVGGGDGREGPPSPANPHLLFSAFYSLRSARQPAV